MHTLFAFVLWFPYWPPRWQKIFKWGKWKLKFKYWPNSIFFFPSLHFTLNLFGLLHKSFDFFCDTNCKFSPCLHELLEQDQQYPLHEEKLELCWKINTTICILKNVNKWIHIYKNNYTKQHYQQSYKQLTLLACEIHRENSIFHLEQPLDVYGGKAKLLV